MRPVFFIEVRFIVLGGSITLLLFESKTNPPKPLLPSMCNSGALKTQMMALNDGIMVSDCMIRLYIAPSTKKGAARHPLTLSNGSTLHSEASRNGVFSIPIARQWFVNIGRNPE